MASPFNGHEFEQTLGVRDGQGSLVCCSLWGCKELDMTWQLNSNIHHIYFYSCSERQYLGLFRNKQNTLERKAVTALESNQKQAETKGDFDLSKKEPHRMRPMFRQFSDEGTPQPARQKAALLTV